MTAKVGEGPAVGEGRACGKVILLGEHAVVYGSAAIALGIDSGATASANVEGDRDRIEVVPPQKEGSERKVLTADAGDGSSLGRALEGLLSAAPRPANITVRAESALPPGGGLGSSAALAVAVARAVEALPNSEQATEARAAAWEGVYHGTPSGIDTAAALHGGVIRYTRKGGAIPISLGTDMFLCIGSSGRSASTREMVSHVAELRKRRPEVVEDGVHAISALVRNGVHALAAGDFEGLGKLMDLNQMLLAGWLLSTEELETMIAAARNAGALGAKLTGAGGGGAVIALARANPQEDAASEDAANKIIEAWNQAGFDGFWTRVRTRRVIESSAPGSWDDEISSDDGLDDGATS